MNILEKNLTALAKLNPELAQEILHHSQLSKHAEFCETKCGDVNLIYDGTPIHDDIDAIEEANVLVRKIKTEKDCINVFFGLGLGYHLDLAHKKTQAVIAVIEPNLDLLRIALEIVDYSFLFESGRFTLLRDYKQLKDMVNGFIKPKTKVSLTFLPSHYKLYPEILNDIKEEVTVISGLINIGFNTVEKYIDKWVKLFIKNLPYFLRHKEIESLRDRFDNKPALIVSAGPSLDKAISTIKENQDNFVIFCVGTAAKALYDNGIIPDFVVAIESGDCYGQIAGLDIQNLITIPTSHTRFHQADAKRIWNYYPNNMPDVYWMKNKKFIDFDIDDYKNSGSVSFIALFSAMISGCNPIVLTGQDLAFVDGQCYTKGSCYDVVCEYDSIADRYVIKPKDIDKYNQVNFDGEMPQTIKEDIEKAFERASQNVYFVEGQDGKKLPTDGGYVTFIKYFEEVARTSTKFKLINCSKGGAQINGFENLDIESVCKSYALEKINKNQIIEDALLKFRNLETDVPKTFYADIRNLHDAYRRLYRYATELREKGHSIRGDIYFKNASYALVYKKFQGVWGIYEKIRKIIATTPFLSMILINEIKELEEKLNNNPHEDEIKKLDHIVLYTFWFAGTIIFNLEDLIKSLHETLEQKNSIKK